MIKSKTLFKILDFATNCLLMFFAMVFAVIGLSALFLLMIEGDFMNVFGLAGFFLAWICWNARITH